MFLNYKNIPFNPNLQQFARDRRKNMSLAEVLLWKELKSKQIFGLNFDRQKIIGNYIVDFYCPDLGMIVEIDDDSHNHKSEYDAVRENYLEGLQLTVVHLDDFEIRKSIHW